MYVVCIPALSTGSRAHIPAYLTSGHPHELPVVLLRPTVLEHNEMRCCLAVEEHLLDGEVKAHRQVPDTRDVMAYAQKSQNKLFFSRPE